MTELRQQVIDQQYQDKLDIKNKLEKIRIEAKKNKDRTEQIKYIISKLFDVYPLASFATNINEDLMEVTMVLDSNNPNQFHKGVARLDNLDLKIAFYKAMEIILIGLGLIK